MASTKTDERLIGVEKKIPVFTVLKNGAILKNIFVINCPPAEDVAAGNAEITDQEYEEILTVGRHPDCNIMLTHPSVSRFHLQINSKPSSQNLSVLDLSSVHGTWVSDRRIEPGARVDLKEGDRLRIGGSTRVYRLHWVPLSQAYDMDHPFVPKLNESVTDMKDEENASSKVVQDENLLFDENSRSEVKEEICQEANHLPVENSQRGLNGPLTVELKEGTSQDWNSLSAKTKQLEEKNVPFLEEGKYDGHFQVINSLPSNDNSEVVQIENLSVPPMTENLKTSFSDEEWNDISGNGIELTKIDSLWCEPVLTEPMDIFPPLGGLWETGDQNLLKDIATEGVCGTEHTASPVTIDDDQTKLSMKLDSFTSIDKVEYNQDAEISEEDKSQSPSRKSLEVSKNISSLSSRALETESMTTIVPLRHLSETKFGEENQTPEAIMICQLSSATGRMKIPEAVDAKTNLLVDPLEACLNENGHSPATKLLEETENKVIGRRNHGWKEISSPVSVPLATESVNSSQPVEHLFEIIDLKFNKEKNLKTPQSRFAAEDSLHSPTVKSEKKCSSIWSRRGKSRSVLQPQVQTDKSRGKIKKVNADAEDEMENQDIENRSITKALFSSLDGDEGEVFTPDKENFTPNTLLLKCMKKKGMLEGIELCNSNNLSFSKVECSSNVNPEEDMLTASDKENQTPKILQEKKPEKVAFNQARLEKEIMVIKKNVERVPFQCLHVNSAGKSKSQASLRNSPLRKSNTVNSSLAMPKTMNNTSSVNNSVGKATRSWNMVVDTTTLLNKESMKSLKLLQGLKGTRLVIPRTVKWELDCLQRRGYLLRSNTEVASALEWIDECMLKTKWWIQVQNSLEEGSLIAQTPPASRLLSACASLMDVFSPTAEDHIVENALLLKKINNDGQLVLLSNDVTTKIKAMAEGLICETAEEFRESLVNPFSERFLWADSSPRGQTWSHSDEVALWDKYQHFSIKKSWNEGAKGLKLILLRNSHYVDR